MPEIVDLETYREQWLVDVNKKNASRVELGRRFAHKLARQWLDIDDSSAVVVDCDGSGDGGIDVAYLDPEDDQASTESVATKGRTWYLFQSKYGAAFAGSSALMSEGRKVVDTLEGRRPGLSCLADGLLERLIKFRNDASERDRVVLVLGTEYALCASERRALDDLRQIGLRRLGPLFDVESASIQTIYQRTLDRIAAKTIDQRTVPLTGSLVACGQHLLVGSTSLIHLYEFLKAYRDQTQDLDQLYESNVRHFLGTRGKVNRGMRDTLRTTPEQFGLYNNGVTLVVADFESAATGTHRLVDPQIVNGCQTTRTIWDVLHSRLTAAEKKGVDPEIQAWRLKAALGAVVMKIVKVGTDQQKLAQAITRYTNAQNAMRGKDFLALTSIFQAWSCQMAERYGVYLEIQRGGWDSRRALQKRNPALQQYQEAANAFDLLKVYGAGWLGEPALACSSNAAFLPGGLVFKRTLQQNDSDFGVEDLYASHLLKTATESFNFDRISPRDMQRPIRFLYYMIVVDLVRAALVRRREASTRRDISTRLIRMLDPQKEQPGQALLQSAGEVAKAYLIQSGKNCLRNAPTYRDHLYFDLAVRNITA